MCACFGWCKKVFCLLKIIDRKGFFVDEVCFFNNFRIKFGPVLYNCYISDVIC